MKNVSMKKVAVSYVLTTGLLFLLSAATSMSGVFGKSIGSEISGMSVELLIIIQLSIILFANSILHAFFYFGGFKSSPIAKGLGIGLVIGGIYFLITVFGLNYYDINNDSVGLLLSAAGGRIVEYCTGGVMTAVISVSEVHRWGVLKSF